MEERSLPLFLGAKKAERTPYRGYKEKFSLGNSGVASAPHKNIPTITLLSFFRRKSL